MSLESTNNERKISDAEWDQLKEDMAHYRNLIRSKMKNASRSYQHILRNVIFGIYPDKFEEVSLDERPELYKEAYETIDYIKRYFKLLEDFPDFAEKELKPGGGYFPELMNILPGASSFIDVYESKLRKT